MPASLAEFRGPVKALFTDLDGTMISGCRLEAETVAALYQLSDARVPVVLVTGRPAGWGHSLGSVFPFAAVVTENGGVSYVPEGGSMRKLFGVPEADLRDWRRRMQAALSDVVTEVPGARLSTDSAYREVDLAIDWNEEASLPAEDADHIVELLRSRGLAASRSSVHVNFGPPCFDKFTACREILAQVFDADPSDLSSFAFVGDSLNDAPMFARFPSSFGVANVMERWDELQHKPKYITSAPEGAGFRELVAHILTLQV